jgi:hypothetical protein
MQAVLYLFLTYRSTQEIIEFCRHSTGFERFLNTKRRTIIVTRPLPMPSPPPKQTPFSQRGTHFRFELKFSALNPFWTRIKVLSVEPILDSNQSSQCGTHFGLESKFSAWNPFWTRIKVFSVEPTLDSN